MKPIPLSIFVGPLYAGGQVRAGQLLGLAQCTISLMVNSGRQIYVIPDAESGGWTYYEIKSPAKKDSLDRVHSRFFSALKDGGK